MKCTVFFVIVFCAFFASCKSSTPATPAPPSTDNLPKIDTFTASASSVNVNQAVTLTWTTRLANGCSILPGVGNVQLNGSTTVTMTTVGTTTFQLTAVNGYGSVKATCPVTVTN